MKPVLEIDLHSRYAGWNRTLHRFLVESDIFSVTNSALPTITKGGRRSSNMSCLRVNGVQVSLDTWDTDWPSRGALENGEFDAGGPHCKTTHLLKIQHRPDNPLWKCFKEIGVNATGWTMFPCADFPLGFFTYDPATNHRYISSVGCASRPGRHQFDGLEGTFGRVGKIVANPEYYNVMQQCRWGFCMKGKRGTDGKTRREVEFSSCGIPLALTYQPHYPFPFVAGTHYVLIQNADDFLKLKDIDPRPYAEASAQIYRERFSPQGAAKTLLELLETSIGI